MLPIKRKRFVYCVSELCHLLTHWLLDFCSVYCYYLFYIAAVTQLLVPCIVCTSDQLIMLKPACLRGRQNNFPAEIRAGHKQNAEGQQNDERKQQKIKGALRAVCPFYRFG